ncbi:MAG: UDP-N-acetylglucosamine--N-acetylmuramyl-(pentapeptide) pyrophosphoryl-undecaprenol N-acetylglucosamine transferase, partial [Clostridia bacterium]|nr:UDP-N-acetylglucosamine--N-acetylmuramyl-(pentapeptide) pyrophosphoryl-undecaprenol N-acetylglucosamine transferase [Clostridia bacterium]
KNIGRNISAARKAVTSSFASKKLLNQIKPDIVVGTGGYVSGPVLKTAQRLGIKTVIHEQNAFPGVTTKMLAGNANAVMLAMPDAKRYLKLNKEPVITGNPVRGELLKITKEEARARLNLDDRPLILSFGGSLGARKINEAVCGLIKWHNGTHNFYHIHATGKTGYESVINALSDVDLSKEIDIREYINDMDICMAAADLVICRAGAITLSEISAMGKPAILIPSPYVAENHQYHNAMTLKRIGAAQVIEEKNLSDALLIQTVSGLINNKPKLEKMSQSALKNAIIDANQRIYEVIMRIYTGA